MSVSTLLQRQSLPLGLGRECGVSSQSPKAPHFVQRRRNAKAAKLISHPTSRASTPGSVLRLWRHLRQTMVSLSHQA
jgi:hypothetical protein